MSTTNSKSLRCGWIVALTLCTLLLAALPALGQKVNVTYLTSDIPNVASPSSVLDHNLVNPWGLSISPSGPWWVSDNGTGLSTLYDGTGQIQSLVVTIPTATGSGTGTPTGTVYNSSTSDFKVHLQATPFLFCTEDGTISGWYAGAQAYVAVNNNSSGAVYKGMTLGQVGSSNYLYVANFHAATIEAYDGSFNLHSFGSNAFVDTAIPSGYAPFNVQNIGSNRLVVTYAKQDAEKHDDVPGPGNGFVDIYDTQGNLQLRLPHIIFLDSPWAVVVAPQSFIGFSGDLLIGNFGSGLITAFNPSNGVWIGNMLAVSDLPVRIDGLWALAFGNGGSGGPTSTMYFTAGPYGENHGLFGMITPHPGL